MGTQAWLLFSYAVWKVVCGPTAGVDGAVAKELFAECAAGARLRSWSPPRRLSICKVGRLTLIAELGGPTLVALELLPENPHEAEPMCVCRELGISGGQVFQCLSEGGLRPVFKYGVETSAEPCF